MMTQTYSSNQINKCNFVFNLRLLSPQSDKLLKGYQDTSWFESSVVDNYKEVKMAVEAFASPTHKAVVFTYDQSLVKGKKITITAENSETGDVGTREAGNTGTFVLFYPFDFTGTDNITVSGAGNSGSDSGTVEIV